MGQILLFCFFAAAAPLFAEPAAVEKFRAEMRQTMASYPRQISTQHGNEYRYLEEVPAGVVVSLGSGPDIFRPLLAFPRATEFHLIDYLRGWGSGPEDVLAEIEKRAQFLAPDAAVTTVRLGFRAVRPEGRVGRMLAEDRSPWIFDVAWTSPALGAITKRFYVHPLNFSRGSHARELLRRLARRKITGLLCTGFSPKPAVLGPLAMRLPVGGAVVTDVNATIASPVLGALIFSGAFRHTVAKSCAGYFADGRLSLRRELVLRRVH